MKYPEDICVPHECLPKGNLSSVAASQPLPPAIPVITQWSPKQSGHGGKDRDCGGAQQYELLLTKARLGCGHCYVLRHQQKPMLSPYYETVPCGDQPGTWWQIDFIESFPS